MFSEILNGSMEFTQRKNHSIEKCSTFPQLPHDQARIRRNFTIFIFPLAFAIVTFLVGPTQGQVLLGLAHDGPDDQSTLYRFDLEQGTTEAIGSTGFERCNGMDFDLDGVLFATCERSDGTDTHVLITINTKNGIGTEIGAPGIESLDVDGDLLPDGLETATDISFREEDGVLFANFAEFDVLATIDTDSGQASIIGPTNLAAPGAGLAFVTSPQVAQGTEVLVHANDSVLGTMDQIFGNFFPQFSTPLVFPSPADDFPRVNALDFQIDANVLWASIDDSVGDTSEHYLGAISDEGIVFIVAQAVNGLDAIAAAPKGHDACPSDVLLSNFQTSPSDNQYIEVANVGDSEVSLNQCSLVTFNVFTETSIGAGTVALTGIVEPGETVRFDFPASLPRGPGAIGIYDVMPPPRDGSPFTQVNEITGMVYINSQFVFGASHLRVPEYNEIYNCIYGGFPFPPLSDCFGGDSDADLFNSETEQETNE